MGLATPVTSSGLKKFHTPRCQKCSKKSPVLELDANGIRVCAECSVYEPLVTVVDEVVVEEVKVKGI